jgi:Putative Flp pilus-assembly TadE/G-like/von Willebrand factor type A domain
MNLFFKRFYSDCSGNIIIISAISFFFLIGIGGAGYDLGKQQLVKQRIQQAADAAAVAASVMGASATPDQRKLMAKAVFELNYPNMYMGVSRPAPNIELLGDSVRVSANTSVPSSFVGTLGISATSAGGASRVLISKEKKEQMPTDFVFVLDISESMREWLKRSSGTAGPSAEYYAPYIEGDMPAMIKECEEIESSAAWFKHYPGSTYAQMCGSDELVKLKQMGVGYWGATRVNVLRKVALEFTDKMLNASPDVENRVGVIKWGIVLGKVHEFTSDYNKAKSYLMSMSASGGATDSSLGMQAAFDDFAPKFRPGAKHVIFLMTDGRNNAPNSDSRTLELCTKLKALPDTVIFTMILGMEDINYRFTGQLFSDCASPPNGEIKTVAEYDANGYFVKFGYTKPPNENIFFFNVHDYDKLKFAFDTIYGVIQNVRIVE